VILLDANVLVYANDATTPEHSVIRPWFEERLNGRDRVGLPWPTLLAFIRLVSNPQVVKSPVSVSAAWQRSQEWLSLPNVWIPTPGPAHSDVLACLLRAKGMTSRLVSDAHLAALAIEHGLTLCSTDGDFARFAGLSWQNPLAAS
jgi:toxin-antitoxin system PIN domain toxin